MIKVFNQLSNKIKQVVETEEIALLKIKDGLIIPIFKNNTEILPVDKWFNFHEEYISLVKNDKYIEKTINENVVSMVKDTSICEKRPVEWDVLKVKSIYFFPISKNNKVVAIIDLAYVNNYYEIADAQVKEIEEIISEYADILKEI